MVFTLRTKGFPNRMLHFHFKSELGSRNIRLVMLAMPTYGPMADPARISGQFCSDYRVVGQCLIQARAV